IHQKTLKQSTEFSIKTTQNESNTVHRSLFDAISSTQRATNMTSTQNLESDDKQRDFDTMLELKRRDAARPDSVSKKFLSTMGTFEDTSSNNPPSPSITTKTSEYRELLCQ
ncbi:unnamed protein product, partial [Adineta steineri]